MRDLFILWIIIQLIAIGWAAVEGRNQIINNTYDCKRETTPHWVGMAFPLVAFIPDYNREIQYCNERN